ncbi:MAG: hypothetical protein R3B96_06665 [Pirellulaceae bacterium]
MFQNESTTSIGDIAIAPSQPETIYVGTGEANNQRSSYWGNGVYRSDDGGATWRHLGLEQSHHIARIVVSPTDPNQVFVAAMGPLYSRGGERGVFRSLDGGQTWEHTLSVGIKSEPPIWSSIPPIRKSCMPRPTSVGARLGTLTEPVLARVSGDRVMLARLGLA